MKKNESKKTKILKKTRTMLMKAKIKKLKKEIFLMSNDKRFSMIEIAEKAQKAFECKKNLLA